MARHQISLELAKITPAHKRISNVDRTGDLKKKYE